MKRAAKSTIRSTVLWTALMVTLGVGASACSSEKEDAGAESGEVMAVDRVDAAAELARKNGPVAEEMAFEETAPIAAEVDATASAEGAAAAADMPEATAAADSNMADMPVADSTEMPTTDATVTDAK